jgi:hypothetical protein
MLDRLRLGKIFMQASIRTLFRARLVRAQSGLPRLVLLFVFLCAFSIIPGCFGTLKQAQQQAFTLAATMHKQMAGGDLAGIYNDADQRYRDAVTRDKSDALFSSIARKLGSPLDCTQGNTNIQVGTSGTTIVSVCSTKYSKDATAVETFTWVKSADRFRLLGYHINSDALIER